MALRRRDWLALALLTAGSGATWAQPADVAPPPELAGELPGAVLRGSATMRWMGLHIYDIRLWSAAPVAGDGSSQPLALELQYARALSGARIADRSLDEMRRLDRLPDATAAGWLKALAALLPDVKAGERVTGVQRPGQGARFFHDGRAIGEVPDAAFARLFFGIWLSPRTSEPGLRAQLLGAPR